MATQQALNNQDLLYAIFEQLAIPNAIWYHHNALTGSFAPGKLQADDRDQLRERRQALACSALVCKSFFLPAASVLWRDLDDAGPLLRLAQLDEVSATPGLAHLHEVSGFINLSGATGRLPQAVDVINHSPDHRPAGGGGLHLLSSATGSGQSTILALETPLSRT